MKGFFFRALNKLVFGRLDVIEPLRQQEHEAHRSAADITRRTQRDAASFRRTGLDLETINAILFRGQPNER